MFGEVYGEENVEVTQHGNVQAAAAFLYGLAAEDLETGALEAVDPDFHLLITVRAVRDRAPDGGERARVTRHSLPRAQ